METNETISLAELAGKEAVTTSKNLAPAYVAELVRDLEDDLAKSVLFWFEYMANSETDCFDEAYRNILSLIVDRACLRGRLLDAKCARLEWRKHVIECLRSFEPRETEEVDLPTIELAVKALECMWSNEAVTPKSADADNDNATMVPLPMPGDDISMYLDPSIVATTRTRDRQ